MVLARSCATRAHIRFKLNRFPALRDFAPELDKFNIKFFFLVVDVVLDDAFVFNVTTEQDADILSVLFLKKDS